MNFTPLDSSRQRASFQIKIFATFAKKKKILFWKIFGSKEAQKKLACQIHRSKSLNNGVMAV
jgi:hypothetical protein